MGDRFLQSLLSSERFLLRICRSKMQTDASRAAGLLESREERRGGEFEDIWRARRLSLEGEVTPHIIS